MKQIGRLKALEYPSDEDLPGSEAISLLRVEYKNEGGDELGAVEIVKLSSTPPEFFGRSEATVRWVRLSRSIVEGLESELENLLPE